MGLAHWIDIGGMDELGRLDTPVHRLDARAKSVVTVAFIAVLMSFDRHELSALTPFALFPLVMLSLGQLPLLPLLPPLLLPPSSGQARPQSSRGAV